MVGAIVSLLKELEVLKEQIKQEYFPAMIYLRAKLKKRKVLE
jgi:hypothetical protein